MAAECEPESLRRLRVTLECLASRIPEIALQRVEQVYPALQQDSVRSVTVPELIVNKTEDCKVKLQQAEASYPTLTPDLILEQNFSDERPQSCNSVDNTVPLEKTCNEIPTRRARSRQPADDVVKESRTQKRSRCKVCGKSVIKHNFAAHMRVHDGVYSCDKCNRSFGWPSVLEEHERVIHTNKRPYKCKQCDASFKKKHVLSRHVDRVHCGMRPHVCHICNISYSCVSSLNKHLAHIGEAQYSCEMCSKSFTSKLCFYHHVNQHFQSKD